MKQYQSHKQVQAGRIVNIERVFNCWEITLEDGSQFQEGGTQFANAEKGGYFVLYPDGYKSYSPAKPFEEGYREIADAGRVPFSIALEALKAGRAIARAGWNGKGMFAYMVPGNSYPAQTGVAKAHFGEGGLVPYNDYMALKGADGTVSTWAPSGSDTLADDWLILDLAAGASAPSQVHPNSAMPSIQKYWADDSATDGVKPMRAEALDGEADRFKRIAEVAHEVNRAYCAATGDDSQPAWADAPDWQKGSALVGVKGHAAGAMTPEQSHASWLAEKECDGWKYGPVKDPVKKEHPCFMPYDQLPAEQRVKDYLFGAVVQTLLNQ